MVYETEPVTIQTRKSGAKNVHIALLPTTCSILIVRLKQILCMLVVRPQYRNSSIYKVAF